MRIKIAFVVIAYCRSNDICCHAIVVVFSILFSFIGLYVLVILRTGVVLITILC